MTILFIAPLARQVPLRRLFWSSNDASQTDVTGGCHGNALRKGILPTFVLMVIGKPPDVFMYNLISVGMCI